MALDTALKFFCMAALWAGFWIGNAEMHGEELKTIAILDFDLVDDQRELSPATVEYQRLTAIRDQLQDELAKNHLYRASTLLQPRSSSEWLNPSPSYTNAMDASLT